MAARYMPGQLNLTCFGIAYTASASPIRYLRAEIMSGEVPSMNAGYQQRPGGPGRGEGTPCDTPQANMCPAPAATTPNSGGTTRYCAGPSASSFATTSLTSAAGLGRRPGRPRGRPRQGVRSGLTSRRPRSSVPASWPGPDGLRNVTFEHANAQVHRFPPERFDLAISRFGTMFFGDPVAAFANIRRALRPAGRLVMMVWQAHERNEWDVAIDQSLGAAEGPVAGTSGDRIRSRSPTRRP